jgi:hypothetical protein
LKRITVSNYTGDKYYPRVVRAVDAVLGRGDVVSPIDVFVEMGLLDPAAVRDWRSGRVPFLEKVIRCNLSVASRVLRILRMHAHDLRLRPSATVYRRSGRGRKTLLRFSKNREAPLEAAYGRHFVRMSASPPAEERGAAQGERLALGNTGVCEGHTR